MRGTSGSFEILPANLLPLGRQYKAFSDSLPPGSCLIILPSHNQKLRDTLVTVASLLETDGHHVITLLAPPLAPP